MDDLLSRLGLARSANVGDDVDDGIDDDDNPDDGIDDNEVDVSKLAGSRYR